MSTTVTHLWRQLAIGALCGLALIAVSAGAAHAEGEWLVEGQTLAELERKEEKLTVANGSFTLAVPGTATISCSEGSASGKVFEGGGDEITTSFSKCEVVKQAACKVSEPLTMEAKTTPLHAGSSYYEKLEALKEGKPLMTAVIKGKECTLPEESKVEGSVAGEVSLSEQEKQPLSFSEATTKAVNTALKEEEKAELKLSFGKQTAYLAMKPVLSLAGEGAGAEWQRAENTKLCEVSKATCPAGKNYASGTTVTAVNQLEPRFVYEISGNTISVACNVSKLAGTTSAAVGAPLPGSFTAFEFLQCAGGACPVEALNTPYAFNFEVSGPGSGNMIVLNPAFEITCSGKKCVYGVANVQFSFVGGQVGSPPWSARGPKELAARWGSDAACSNTAWWEGVVGAGGKLEYRWTSPLAMYLTG